LKDIEVRVYDNDLEKAMRILKKKIQNDDQANSDDVNSVKRFAEKELQLQEEDKNIPQKSTRQSSLHCRVFL